MNISELCSPAQLYLVISVIAIVMAMVKQIQLSSILYKFVFMVGWTWVLNFLCSKGYKTVSWVLVFLPFIIIMLGIIMVVGSLTKLK